RERAEKEGLEELEIAGIIQREPPRRLGKSRLGIAQDPQGAVRQDIVECGTQHPGSGIALLQLAQIRYWYCPKRVEGLQGGPCLVDHAPHVTALRPCRRLASVDRPIDFRALHDPPAIALVALPSAVHQGRPQQLRL